METFVGAVNDAPAISEAGAHTLNDALQSGSNLSPLLIGTFGDSSIAIFRSGTNFLIFDSHSRNRMGFVDPLGASVLLTFDNFASIIAYLREMYFGQIFNLSPVQLNSLQEPDANSVPSQCLNNAVEDIFTDCTLSN